MAAVFIIIYSRVIPEKLLAEESWSLLVSCVSIFK